MTNSQRSPTEYNRYNMYIPEGNYLSLAHRDSYVQPLWGWLCNVSIIEAAVLLLADRSTDLITTAICVSAMSCNSMACNSGHYDRNQFGPIMFALPIDCKIIQIAFAAAFLQSFYSSPRFLNLISFDGLVELYCGASKSYFYFYFKLYIYIGEKKLIFL